MYAEWKNIKLFLDQLARKKVGGSFLISTFLSLSILTVVVVVCSGVVVAECPVSMCTVTWPNSSLWPLSGPLAHLIPVFFLLSCPLLPSLPVSTAAMSPTWSTSSAASARGSNSSSGWSRALSHLSLVDVCGCVTVVWLLLASAAAARAFNPPVLLLLFSRPDAVSLSLPSSPLSYAIEHPTGVWSCCTYNISRAEQKPLYSPLFSSLSVYS